MPDSNDKIIADLYQDSAQESPPAALDQRILDAASHKKNRFGWLYPLSTAAAVLLGVTFLLNLPNQVDQQMQVDSMPVTEPAPMPKSKQQPVDKDLTTGIEASLEEVDMNSSSTGSRQEAKKEQMKPDASIEPAETPATESALGLIDTEKDVDNLTLDQLLKNTSGKRAIQPQKPATDVIEEDTAEGTPAFEPASTQAETEARISNSNATDDFSPTATRARAPEQEQKTADNQDRVQTEHSVLQSRTVIDTIHELTKEKIQQLLLEGKLDAASEYLETMKKHHPDIDWSELDALLIKAKN